MAVKFFGQFLVEQGIVSRDNLLKAIELQERKNLKLGEMALSMGYCTHEDIDRAHLYQLTKDMKLGDILVELGILTLNQLNEVLVRQKNDHLFIGEALLLVDALSKVQLQKYLDDFKADQALYVSDRIELPISIPNSNIWEMTADLTYKMITRVLGIQFRPGKCKVVTTLDTNFMMAAMDLIGDVNARYIVSISANLQLIVARAILREASVDGEPPEVLEDTVMEFINVVCGNVAAKASQMGKIININPPVTIRPPAEGIPVPGGQTALCFPIHVGEADKLELILLIRQ